jgi:small subunit ribosomal protein S6
MQMQRTYEVMFIVRPDQSDEDIDKLISTMETNITNAGGKVKSAEKMGKRRMAYLVRKFIDGFYVLLTLEGSGELIKEIERRLRVTEQVIKFISVRTDVEDKRLAKIKKLRDSRVKGQGRQAAAAAEAAAAAAEGAEPTPAQA